MNVSSLLNDAPSSPGPRLSTIPERASDLNTTSSPPASHPSPYQTYQQRPRSSTADTWDSSVDSSSWRQLPQPYGSSPASQPASMTGSPVAAPLVQMRGLALESVTSAPTVASSSRPPCSDGLPCRPPHHRCSESESSLSSYTSSAASDAPSRTSSLATSHSGCCCGSSPQMPAISLQASASVPMAAASNASSMPSPSSCCSPSSRGLPRPTTASPRCHSPLLHHHRASPRLSSSDGKYLSPPSPPRSTGPPHTRSASSSAAATRYKTRSWRDEAEHRLPVPSSSVPDSTLHHAQSHKRIVSAPPGTLESDAMPETRSSVAAAHDGHHHHYSHRLAAEPVGPMSPAASSTHADDLAVTPATLPGAASPAVPTPPPELHCMYTENCDTGAQPRKVITHFFGRNKSCTMMIPPEVWVHYCRKHYQRVRYRNFDSFPLVQIDLVRTQVERIDAWSLENQRAKSSGGPGSAASGPPGRYVKAWTLALRKREQRRLGGAASGDDDANSTDEATSAPPWVRKSVGNGYTTAQILAIVERLKDELVAETLDAIPDIEFLPEICDESLDGPGGPGSGSGSGSGRRSGGTTRRYNKRKSMHAAGPSGARPMHDDKRPRIMTVDEAAPRSMPPPPSHLDQHHRHYVLDTRDDWRAPPGGHWAERHPHHHAPHGHHGQGHYVFQGGQPHSHVAAPPPRPPQRLPLPGAHSHAPPPPRYLPPIVDSPGPETASAYWNGSGHQAPWAGRPYYAEPPRVLPPPR